METSPTARGGPFWVQIDRDGEALVVRAFGELDLATVEMLRNPLLDAFESHSASITLDLTEVGFIDSVGMQALLWAAARSDGDLFRIRCGSDSVRKLIELCGLEESLPLSV
jgi:anti-anti-sigma factor